MIEFDFYGRSHGENYGGTIKGLPEGYSLDISEINRQLFLRKTGYGRSSRQQNEKDEVCFVGLNEGKTAREFSFTVPNGKHSVLGQITALRSGHADLTACVKYGTKDVRDVAERASARSSVCYVVLGAVCKQILAKFGIFTYSQTLNIGGVAACEKFDYDKSDKPLTANSLGCTDATAAEKMKEAIDQARSRGDSLGGETRVIAAGVPMGLGDFFPYSKRLDGKIAGAMMSIPSVKAVSFGAGHAYACLSGVESHDELAALNGQIVYATDKCGGIVGGISNGREISLALTVKAVPTVKNVSTVDFVSLETTEQHYERADTCVVPNVGTVAENMLAYVLLDEILSDTPFAKKLGLM